MKKTIVNRRKGKKLVHKPLPQVLHLSQKGPSHPNLVKVIKAFRNED
jgi:hypothetical protein